MNRGRLFQDTLIPSKVRKSSSSSPTKRKRIHISNVKDNLTLTKKQPLDDKLDGLLNVNNVDLSIMNKLDSLSPKKRASPSPNVSTSILSDEITKLPAIDYNINSILNEDDKINRIKLKYRSNKLGISNKSLNSHEVIRAQVLSNLDLLINIIKGDHPSYFYTLAKKIQRNSPGVLITNDELISLPKSIYTGYIGSKRSQCIKSNILDCTSVVTLLTELDKFSKVVQFWGIDKFVTYVLCPELIAIIIMNDLNLNDIQLAYDIMEDTNDYGLYIMDKIPIKESHSKSSSPKKQQKNTNSSSDTEDLISLFD